MKQGAWRIWFLIVIGVVGLMAYVRFAPSETARWHVPVEASADKDMAGGAVRIIPGGADEMTRLDVAMQALPRTEVLAGSAAEGRVTYVTRSKWMGFPDYTTLEGRGDQIAVFARLRFGKSDVGVNKARLEKVLER